MGERRKGPGAPLGDAGPGARTTISGLPGWVWLCAQSPVVSAHRCPNSPAGGREGHSRRKMSRPPQSQTTVAGEADGSWAEAGLRALRGSSWHTLLSILGTAPCRRHGPPCSLLAPGRPRLRFASSLGVGLTSKNEFEENRRRSRHATAPSAHWPPVKTLVFGVMFPEGLPLPPPLPTHLTRCWPIALAGIKWLLARRAPSQEASPPAGAGRSLGTQHAGTANAEDATQ